MNYTRKGYLTRRGKVYYARWNVNKRKYSISTGQTDRKKALVELARMMAPFVVGNDIRVLETVKARIEGAKGELDAIEEERNPPLRLKNAWSAYLTSPEKPDSGPATMKEYESHFEQFAAWMAETHPQDRALRDVSTEQANEYASHLTRRGLSGNRFNKHVRFLALLFRVLHDKAKLGANPWERIKRKRQIPNSRRELTIEELQAVCAAAQGEMRLLFAIGMYTGLRLGDCASLRWCEVDMVLGEICRITNKTASRNSKPVRVPIHPTLRALLAETPTGSRGEYVLPETAARIRDNPVSLTLTIQAHFAACGIRTHRPGTGFEVVMGEDGTRKTVDTGKRAVLEVGFHSLRHTLVSLCRAANVPLSVVEAIVGHSNPAMTRHYTHTGHAAALAAVSALPSIGGEGVALLPAPERHLVDAVAVREIAQGMTAKTWKDGQAELLKLTDFPPVAVTPGDE